MDRFLYGSLLLLLFGTSGVWPACEISEPPTLMISELVEGTDGVAYIFYCEGPNVISNGNAIVRATMNLCFMDDWYRPIDSQVCSDRYANNVSVQCEEPIEYDNSVTTLSIDGGPHAIGLAIIVYACSAGFSWASTMPVRHASCINGKWSTVYDFCDEECTVSQDCSSISNQGFSTDGNYRVFPSGNFLGDNIMVYCLLEGVQGDTGWTLILYHNVSESLPDQISPLHGFGLVTAEDNYFIGINNLSLLNTYVNGSKRPLVFKITLGDFLQNTYHITYDNVVFGTPELPIKTLGNAHGTAGDFLRDSIDLPFQCTSGGCFWGQNSTSSSVKIDDIGISWGSLPRAKFMTIYARPKDYDQENSCPTMVVEDPAWHITTVMTIPDNRAHGTIVSYSCINGLTGHGSSTCQTSIASVGLGWSEPLDVPCKVTCPPGFFTSANLMKCVQFTTESARSIVHAAFICRDLGASLAIVADPLDLTNATKGNEYYTAHIVWGRSVTSLSQEMNPAVSCVATNSCDTDGNECLFVNRDGYEPGKCGKISPVMCMIPAWCPTGYVEFDGLCYVAHSTNSPLTPLDALQFCTLEGGVLAFPEYLSVLEFLVSMQILSRAEISRNVLIGLNDAHGDWTAGGMYSPNSTILDLVSSTVDNHWQVIQIDATYSIQAVPLDFEASHIVCQYPGSLTCITDPPATLENMTYFLESYQLGDAASYTCNLGYFVEGNISHTTQNKTCLGQLGGWYPPGLLECSLVPVCLQDPVVQSSLITFVLNPGYNFYGGSINYTCPDQMMTRDSETVQTSNCSYSDTAGFEFSSAVIVICDVCALEPSVPEGMETNWLANITYFTGSELQVTCQVSHFVSLGVDTQNISCTDVGWSEPLPCYEACTEEPPLPAATMISGTPTLASIGEVVNYSCTPGFYIQTEQGYDDSLEVTCEVTQLWEPAVLPVCEVLCVDEPPKTADLATSDWDNVTRTQDTIISITCPKDYLFADLNDSHVITCTDGVWSSLDPAINHCVQVIDVGPSSNVSENISLEIGPPPYVVGTSVNYTCPENTVFPSGLSYFTITATENGWSEIDPDATCIKIFPFEAPVVPENAEVIGPEEPYVYGIVLNYTCKAGFNPLIGGKSYVITAETDGWTPTLHSNFICLDPNVPYVPLPTEPPVEFPDVNAEEQAYSDTADMHVASLNTAMEDVNGVPDNFGDTIGPFGFGKSVNLSSAQQQCLKKINYGPEGDCSMDPSLCTNGFSISIWEKAEFDEGHFYLVHKTDTENKRYIISTGGDEYGHPGLSLYHQGLALKAVVSTGDMFWTARAFGAVPPGVWTNLGIRWTQSFGLELYVNTRRVGQGKIGYTSTRQEPLNPSELIVGCHKTSSDPVYRDFNNAEFDELAIWTSALPDENLVYFLGGYNGEMKHLSPKEYEFMLKQTDMGDPRQAQRAFAVLGDISRDALKPVVIETTENGTSSSTASENAAGATVGVSDRADRLQPWVDVVESMTSINNVKDKLPSSEMPAFAGIIHPISNLMNESAAEDWERYQKENIGSPFVMKRMEEYLMYTMRNIRFKNQELSFSHVEVADNIVASMDKLLIRDYEYNGKFVTPNLKKIPEVREGWGGISKAEIPNTLFKNHHCGTRPVNILSNLYKDLDHIAPMRLNPKTLNTGVRNALDSRVLSVNVIPDPPVYPGDSWCYPSQKQLQEDPLLLVLEHLNPQDVRPSRKLLFHENETLSDLAERHCVWWNARHGDLGAWDTEGCTKMESTVYFTKCTCSHFGVFSVMAEETETIEVPDEPFWLTIVRYTLYSISALCLILYIAVVGLSGDLKDQFHMTGLNLAAVLLAGSVFMIISDFESIRENRHACTIIGSFLHIFYLVAGGWIAVLGHAVFKSITSGIIQGLMNQYFLIPWGVTFMSFGLSYAAYLQDLGTDPRCFISWYNDVKHIFFFPLVICILVANFCAITIFFNLKTTALRGNPAMKEYMSFSIGGAVLVFYFTFTWIIGMFTYYQWESSSYIYPVFQIFNGLMGVVLLVCIGFLSSRFKMVLAGQAKRRKEMLMNMRKELSTKSDDKKKLHQRKSPKAKKVRDSQGEPPAASLRRPSNVDLEEERIGTWIPNEL